MNETIDINGRLYRTPVRPTVIVCFDGFDPAYLARGVADGILPTLASFKSTGLATIAHCVVPSFTNPNNVSIVTGVPPSVHGISGNSYLDKDTGEEVMVTDARLLRCDTILACMARIGVRVAAITAKDKLRKILSHDFQGIAFSAQCAAQATIREHGIDNVESLVGRSAPRQYDADLSLFVLDAGIRLIEEGRVDLVYLSLSDLVQHSNAPGTTASNDFHSAVDARLALLIRFGTVLGVVADHGMNDKADATGNPNVIFLQDELEKLYGPGAVRVTCPITDPFVRHHGALGSYVRVYARGEIMIGILAEVIASLPGVELVLPGHEAARRFDLPSELEGDLAVLGDRKTVIGSSVKHHDLSGLAGHRLRSHGGLGEQRVPFLLSHPLRPAYRSWAASRVLRNFDIFDFALNGVLD